MRFVIAFVIFLLQQWSGQNSVGYVISGVPSFVSDAQSVSYYAPQIFASVSFSRWVFLYNRLTDCLDWLWRPYKLPACIGYLRGHQSAKFFYLYWPVSWCATSKVGVTAIFIFGFVELLGRKLSLFISSMGMGSLFFIIGAILKTHPPPQIIPGQPLPNPPPASKAMAAILYIYVCFYSMGCGKPFCVPGWTPAWISFRSRSVGLCCWDLPHTHEALWCRACELFAVVVE